MLLMHFLNKVCLVPISLDDFFIHPLLQVHFNAPMNPLELEVYHQIKNIIGDRVPIQLIISSLRTYGLNTYLTFANSSLISDKKV